MCDCGAALTPPRGGEACPEPARSLAPTPLGGEGKEEGGREWERESRETEAADIARRRRGNRLCPRRPLPGRLQVESAECADSAATRAATATFQAPRVLAWEYSVFVRASPMAEGRRREDEEEELRERRELGGPRRARGRALSGHPAAGEGCGERAGGRGTGPRAGRLGAAQVLLRTAAALHLPRWDGHLPEARGRVAFHHILILTF